MLTCFGMIWNCDNFSRWTQNLAKFVDFQKFILFQHWLFKKWYIGVIINIINKNFQDISFENSCEWNHGQRS
jgi:hypothetical protein